MQSGRPRRKRQAPLRPPRLHFILPRRERQAPLRPPNDSLKMECIPSVTAITFYYISKVVSSSNRRLQYTCIAPLWTSRCETHPRVGPKVLRKNMDTLLGFSIWCTASCCASCSGTNNHSICRYTSIIAPRTVHIRSPSKISMSPFECMMFMKHSLDTSNAVTKQSIIKHLPYGYSRMMHMQLRLGNRSGQTCMGAAVISGTSTH